MCQDPSKRSRRKVLHEFFSGGKGQEIPRREIKGKITRACARARERGARKKRLEKDEDEKTYKKKEQE